MAKTWRVFGGGTVDNCGPLCVEFGGHPNGPFCTTPERAAEVGREAVLHQLRSARIALDGLSLDADAWLAAEDDAHGFEWREAMRRAVSALDDLASLAQPKDA